MEVPFVEMGKIGKGMVGEAHSQENSSQDHLPTPFMRAYRHHTKNDLPDILMV